MTRSFTVVVSGTTGMARRVPRPSDDNYLLAYGGLDTV
jgi:hypothetical protein